VRPVIAKISVVSEHTENISRLAAQSSRAHCASGDLSRPRRFYVPDIFKTILAEADKMEERATGLTIRTVSLAARCEVCHQTDLFDPTTNACSRCGNIALLCASSASPTAPPPDFADQFWDLLLSGVRGGAVAAGLTGALSSLALWFFAVGQHPLRTVLFFTGVGFFLGLLAGVVKRGGNEDTLRISAYNAAYAFVFGGLISGALFFINWASPNLNALDFVRFLVFCLLGSAIFATGGGFVGAVLSVLIPPHHPLRRAPASQFPPPG
jgi:hypothetical protein